MKSFFCIVLLSISFILVAEGFRPLREAKTDVSQILTKLEIEDAIGGPINDAPISTDKSIIRYYAVDGTPYLEAMSFAVLDENAEASFLKQKNIMRSVHYYQGELPEFGEKAYWCDNTVTTDIHVIKDSKELSISVSQSKSGISKLDAAKKLMKLALSRL